MEELMLTTVDNPYNPFTEYDKWFAFDESKGYNSCDLLGRVATISDSLSDEDQMIEINRAIQTIVRINPSGMHRAVTRTSFPVGEGGS